MKIMSVVGARPNFMKIAPFIRAVECAARGKGQVPGDITLEHCLVHTGQHYDDDMSRSFFGELNIPLPDVNLGVGSGTHAEQVGKTMMAFEVVVKKNRPDVVVVVGDVNATCACSIVAKKEGIKLAHIEAGLRSFDMSMPEEVNRMITDRLADLLFTTDKFADGNLKNEGVSPDKIKFVGNIMIDTLEANREKAEKLELDNIISAGSVLSRGLSSPCLVPLASLPFTLLTLHRPSNVDRKEKLRELVRFFIDVISVDMPLVWILHPRTKKQLESLGLWSEVEACDRIILLNPAGYLQMLKLNMEASVVLTDSGGLQEECCVLGTPCITLRENTERPVTLRENGGVSVLVGNDISRIEKTFRMLKGKEKKSYRPPLWDGRTAERIVREMMG